MARVKMSKIDWKNKASVISFAKKLGKGMLVFYNGTNYQITHAEREKLVAGEIVFRT